MPRGRRKWFTLGACATGTEPDSGVVLGVNFDRFIEIPDSFPGKVAAPLLVDTSPALPETPDSSLSSTPFS